MEQFQINSMKLPRSLTNLIESFERLPGVGPKSAQRLAFYILRVPENQVELFAENLLDVKKKIQYCDICRNLDEETPCFICSDSSRNNHQLMVVTSPMDVFSFEKVGFKGFYHVLHGNIDPLNNIGPDELLIWKLVSRIKKMLEESEKIELILSTSTSLEGESTAMYISKIIKEGIEGSENIKISRIARGIPIGGDIEYADDITLSRALDGRSDF